MLVVYVAGLANQALDTFRSLPAAVQNLVQSFDRLCDRSLCLSLQLSLRLKYPDTEAKERQW